ncbi:Nucleoside diphosphate kinase [Paramicrosporidium saccamoebae]|uniref:Nucleoside diphosphate kinase n=1 Tax=Paramicrosporidium saccamoebae TaxID=1246581 RepID=A0A2H9TI53_9FUNG|nr:Nucleoside diphosphate kinase [Paramicrosporidium saccamoebae]
MARFEKRGYQLLAAQLMQPGRAHLEKHYADLSSKPFFNGLCDFMASGPVLAMVFMGKDVVKTGRKMLGETNPLASAPGSVRGDYGIDLGRNVCHGSDSVESAEKEIALWFPNGVCSYTMAISPMVYE